METVGRSNFEVMAACIDSGGHHTQKVYEFAKARIGRRVWAIRGESAIGGKRSPVWPTKIPSRRSKSTYRPVILGVNAAKDVIRARLHIEEPGPGYMHFPADRDIGYFAQMTSERSVRKFSAGQHYRVWELPPGRANEALDCRVYSYAALCGLLHLGLALNKRAQDVAGTVSNAALPVAPPIPTPDNMPPPKAPDPPSRKTIVSRLA
jgi:phage terminase large subunit GpA-like protein